MFTFRNILIKSDQYNPSLIIDSPPTDELMGSKLTSRSEFSGHMTRLCVRRDKDFINMISIKCTSKEINSSFDKVNSMSTI